MRVSDRAVRHRVPRLDAFDPRLRTGRTVGLCGSLLLALGAVGAGALPVADPLATWPVVAQLRLAPRISLLVVYAGLTLLVFAWLAIGRPVREGCASTGQLVRVLCEWALPLALAPPLYSRDVYSYVVQGAMYRDGLDPYRLGAAAYGSDLAANVSQFWQHSTAPYGPVFLAVAAAVMAVAGNHVVLGVLGLRLVMLCAFAVTVRCVVIIARRCHLDPARALWLGVLNPLVVLHVVSGAHNDALLVALLLVAMLLAAGNRPMSASALIAAAVLVKASAGVALIFVVPTAARRLRGRATLLRGAVLVAAVAAATMMTITELADAWYGWVTALGDTTRVHNGLSLSTDVGMLAQWLGSVAGWNASFDLVLVARVVGLTAAATLLVVILKRTRGRPIQGLGRALSVVVMFGPVVHPWYAIWGLIPLAATERDPRVIRLVAGVSALLVFYPMPSGGGPGADLALGVLGVVIGGAVSAKIGASGATPPLATEDSRQVAPIFESSSQ